MRVVTQKISLPSLRKFLKVLLGSQTGSLEYLIYMSQRKSIPDFPKPNFHLSFPSFNLSFLLPTVTSSISISWVQSAQPQMALLNALSFIFSYSEPLMTFSCDFLKQTRSSLFMGACYLWSSLLNIDVTSKVLNNNCGGFPSVATWGRCKAIHSKWRLCC